MGRRAQARRRTRVWSRRRARNRFAPNNIDAVNAPTLIGATRIAGHPPTKPEARGNGWQVDNGCNEALRVATPSLTTSNRTTSVGSNSAVVAGSYETTASGKDILKRISTISAEL